MSEDYSAAAERIVNATNLADDDLSTFEDDVRTVALGYLDQAVRIKELEDENERLKRYAATQAASKRAWQQISGNTAGEHDETLARVAELTEALAFYANIREYNPVGGDPPGSLSPIVTGDRGARARAALARDDDA